MKKINYLKVWIFLVFFGLIGTFAAFSGQAPDVSGLADDIPEPPEAKQELPSPVPMIYEFIAGIMAGDQDRCLVNFDVKTFLSILFGKQIRLMSPSDFDELYAYQVQSQRNEFRFLSKVMNRLAKDAKFYYSNPRFHQKVQSKVVIKLKTTKGDYEFIIYCRYIDEKWYVYDYVLDGKRFSEIFKQGFGNMKLDDYIRSLRPFYDDDIRFRSWKNDEFGIAMRLPNYFLVKQKVNPGLLFSISALENQFLMQIQAAVYSKAQTLKQVAAEIKQTIMPLKPRLYDQWKTAIAGVDIGNVLFQFEKNGKLLFAHMVIIPIGEKLVVLNFYHNSLQLMKHFTNLREKILDSIKLTKVEALGGDMSIPADDASLPGKTPTEIQPYDDVSQPGGNMQPTMANNGNQPPQQVEEEIPPPPPEEEGLITPDTGVGVSPPEGDDDGNNPPGSPPKPPPPPDDQGDGGDDASVGDDNPPSPPDTGTSDPEYKSPDDGGGSEVTF